MNKKPFVGKKVRFFVDDEQIGDELIVFDATYDPEPIEGKLTITALKKITILDRIKRFFSNALEPKQPRRQAPIQRP